MTTPAEVSLAVEQIKRAKANARARKYYAANREKSLARRKKYREDNVDSCVASRCKYQAKNPEKGAARQRTFALKHPDRIRAKNIRRDTGRSLRTPPWLSPTQWQAMNDIYLESKRLTAAGDVHHVDHIVPLQGKTVCGLHVPWNLQILTATENMQKNAKFNDWNLTRAEIAALCKLSASADHQNLTPQPTSAPSS